MQLVIDANILMAMLVKPGLPIDLFFETRIDLFAPQLLFKEFENNKKELLKKSKLSEGDFDCLYFFLKQNITIVPEEDFIQFREKANLSCPDPKDLLYFALAFYLRCPIWSNEKRLKKQDVIEVHATHDLIKLFGL